QREATMKSVKFFVLLTVFAFLFAPVGVAQEKTTQQLGKVHFPISCSPAAQEQFERGVAMLHSYWFTEGSKTFEAIVREEPSCVMAYWGLGQLARQFARRPAPGKRRAEGVGGTRQSQG